MAQDFSVLLVQTIERELPNLRALDEQHASLPRGPGKWSPKEELGHLIDSASNNHIRFVRGALEHEVPASEIPALLDGADALLSTTLDGSGDKAVFEAMAARRPAIVSNPENDSAVRKKLWAFIRWAEYQNTHGEDPRPRLAGPATPAARQRAPRPRGLRAGRAVPRPGAQRRRPAAVRVGGRGHRAGARDRAPHRAPRDATRGPDALLSGLGAGAPVPRGRRPPAYRCAPGR